MDTALAALCTRFPPPKCLIDHLVAAAADAVASAEDARHTRDPLLLTPLPQFTVRVTLHSRLPPSTVAAAVVYLRRIKAALPPTARGIPSTPYRLVVAALRLAAKFLLDTGLKTAAVWADACDLPPRELHLMERQVLGFLDYNATVDAKELRRVLVEAMERSACAFFDDDAAAALVVVYPKRVRVGEVLARPPTVACAPLPHSARVCLSPLVSPPSSATGASSSPSTPGSPAAASFTLSPPLSDSTSPSTVVSFESSLTGIPPVLLISHSLPTPSRVQQQSGQSAPSPTDSPPLAPPASLPTPPTTTNSSENTAFILGHQRKTSAASVDAVSPLPLYPPMSLPRPPLPVTALAAHELAHPPVALGAGMVALCVGD